MSVVDYTCPIPGCPYKAVQNESAGYFHTAPRCPNHPTYYRSPAMIRFVPRRSDHEAVRLAFDAADWYGQMKPDNGFAIRQTAADEYAKLATLTRTPHPYIQLKEYLMDDRMIIAQFTDTINAGAALRNRTPEQEFRDLDVHEGDRVRLTEAVQPTSYGRAYGPRQLVKDGSALEGKVIGIKVRGGKTQIRIAGFGHTGPSKAGGQHVWFPVENFKVEVLHKVYRVTDEDRLFIELAGLTEARWAALTDQQRADRRERYAVRADKIRKLLAQ